jgi:hypothetical protein
MKFIKYLAPLLFAFIYFELFYQATSRDTINYKIVTVLGLVLIIIFLIQREHRKTCAIIFFWGLLFLTLGEICFRLKYFGIEGIRSFHQYSPAGIASPIAILERDPETHTGLKPGSKGLLAGVPIYVNNLGFIDRDREFEKKANVFRIVVCGASVSMGNGVEQEKNYSTLLEKMLNERIPSRKYEVINLSMAGYRNKEVLEVLEKFALPFNPDMILIPESIDEEQVLNRRNIPKLTGRDRFFYILERPHTKFFLFRAFQNDIFPSMRRRIRDIQTKIWQAEDGQSKKEKRASRHEESLRDYFKKIKNLTREKKVLILDLRTMRALHEKAAPNSYLKKLSTEFGFGFIHTYDEDYGPLARDMLIFIGDVHPNAKAHRIYAEAIFKAIKPEIESLQK